MSTTFSALITNYNTWQLTNLCARELDRWSKDSLVEILVVDDASDQKAQHENLPTQVRVVYNSKNCGYAPSVNIGFTNIKEDVVILLDSDAYPLMDLTESLDQLFATNPKLGAVGFKLVDNNGQPTGYCSPEPSVLGLLLGQQLSDLYDAKVKRTSDSIVCIHSCGMAIRRTAFEEIGGFDEGFDFLDADIDFSMRLDAAGWDLQIDPNLVAYHEGGGSPQTTAKRVLRHHRNRWRLLSKHGRIRFPFLLKAGLATRHILEYVFLRIVGKVVVKDTKTLQDKIFGRHQLMNSVWSNYDNK
jgi:GT2 family glycosyltransferase